MDNKDLNLDDQESWQHILRKYSDIIFSPYLKIDQYNRALKLFERSKRTKSSNLSKIASGLLFLAGS
jgi:hypothetical protein